jgi:hypothetical protein
LIWITVAQKIKIESENEYKKKNLEIQSNVYQTFHLMLCDIREILLDSNQFERLNVFKDTKMKATFFDVNNLPSCRHLIEENKENQKELTPEEKAEAEFRAFMSGKIIKS